MDKKTCFCSTVGHRWIHRSKGSTDPCLSWTCSVMWWELSISLAAIRVIRGSWPQEAVDSRWMAAISMTDRPRGSCLFFWAPYLSAAEGSVYVPNSSITIRPHTGSGPAFTLLQEAGAGVSSKERQCHHRRQLFAFWFVISVSRFAPGVSEMISQSNHPFGAGWDILSITRWI